MGSRRVMPTLVLTIAALHCACSPRQFPTVTVYDSPQAYVRLEADRTVAKGREHSHPVSLAPEQMAAVLAGIIVVEPIARMPLYDDLSRPRRHQAFTENQIVFLAPLLATALGKATPEEVVTFYLTKRESGGRREVTSGGVYVEGERLHFFLSNYRSPTHYAPDPGTVDTTDDRLTPMQPLAPQRGTLDFEPKEAFRSPVPTGLGRLFHWDRRELIILFRQLTPRSLTEFLAPSPPAPSP